MVAFICVAACTYIAFHFRQLTYLLDSVINKPKASCSTIDIGQHNGSILFKTDCKEVAYLSDFTINKGTDATLNIFGSGEFQVTLSQITSDLDLKRSKLETFTIFANNLVHSFNDRDGFANNIPKQEIMNTSHLPSGWYEVSVSHENGKTFNLVLFIEPNELEEILFVESTDTLLAYNESFFTTGIPNNYNRSNNQNKSANAFFSRFSPIEYKVDKNNFFPIKCTDHLINADMVLKNFLRESAVKFSVVSDSQMDLEKTYGGVKLVIFGAHNEYWTKTKIDKLTKFVKEGGKLLFLGGNTAYREIIRKPNGWLISNSNFKSNKYDFTKIKYLMGTFFEGDMGTSAPLKLTGIDTWNREFGIEIDRNISFGHNTDFQYCKSPIGFKRGFVGASFIETDQLIGDASGFTVLAKGMQKKGGADVVFKEFEGGGKILNFSSVGLWHSLSDPYIADLINSFIWKN